MFNHEQDETWQKLQDLINVGSANSLKKESEGHVNRDSSLGRGMISQPELSSIEYGSMRIDTATKMKDSILESQKQFNPMSSNGNSNLDIDYLRKQISEVLVFSKEQSAMVTQRIRQVENQSCLLENKLNQVNQEQTKIITNYQELENRYKDIIRENKQIKDELLDLRKNRQITTKITPDSSFNLPFNKQTVNDTRSVNREKVDIQFSTPSKLRETERYPIYKYGNSDNIGSIDVFSQEKIRSEDQASKVSSYTGRREARPLPGFSYYGQ